MDKLGNYRQLIRRLLDEYASYKPAYGNIDSEVIVDETQNHFQLMRVGWLNKKRVHGAIIHVDIIKNKIWIQYDGTDRPIADELLKAGVPKDDIVLGFHPEYLRQYTGFAVS